MDVRSHKYANVDSDHYLNVSWIQARISNAKKFFDKKVAKYDQEEMTLLEKQVKYKANVTERQSMYRRLLLILMTALIVDGIK
jgi:hypothetical protein